MGSILLALINMGRGLKGRENGDQNREE